MPLRPRLPRTRPATAGSARRQRAFTPAYRGGSAAGQAVDRPLAAARPQVTDQIHLVGAWDILLALLLATVSVGVDVFGPEHATPAHSWLFDLALTLPLLVRRRWPAGVFLTISAIAFLQWGTGSLVRGDLAVLVALYAVGAHERRRWFVGVAAGIAEIGVLLAVLRWAPPGQKLNGFILLTGTVTAAWVIGAYVRTRRAYLASVLDRAATAERERDHQAQIAVAAERARIAREMHDVVAHSLSVMIALNDGAAASTMSAPEEARAVMGQASSVGRRAMADMRRMLGVLRSDGVPELTPQPGDGQLDDLIARIRSAGLAVELVVTGEPHRSPPGAQLAVHRIVQESLTNILKHAPGATRAMVTLRYEVSGIEVDIANDDPNPFAEPTAEPGHGLTGMRERAAVYGGLVHAGRRPDGGWRVSTRLHLDERDRQP